MFTNVTQEDISSNNNEQNGGKKHQVIAKMLQLMKDLAKYYSDVHMDMEDCGNIKSDYIEAKEFMRWLNKEMKLFCKKSHRIKLLNIIQAHKNKINKKQDMGEEIWPEICLFLEEKN
ncbi:hypothetical protein RFI_15984 [Reticulomyxa filosa]|uniref:Uncharacterized protein n=1 Tax=Reticulomyxa filosa TaxID=46433 RepID=X6N4J9_RETFI|nr:hypothetical protein RFI_15984 [Reticulomyxa filosa]|eukprot:ETO21220.1 hypothetical protein RFI_15984 [Reticulomyxa filosa]